MLIHSYFLLICFHGFVMNSVSIWSLFERTRSLMPTTKWSCNISSLNSTRVSNTGMYSLAVSPGNWFLRLKCAYSKIMFFQTLKYSFITSVYLFLLSSNIPIEDKMRSAYFPRQYNNVLTCGC